jgi:signal transduction histidine kinase
MVRALAAAVLLGLAPSATAANTSVLLKAEFLPMGEDSGPPPSDAKWQSVVLPHTWYRTNPGLKGYGWYRIEFSLPVVPRTMQAIEVDHWRSQWIDFFVNGSSIGGSRDTIAGGGLGFGTPVFLTVPPSLLRPGSNELLAHMLTRLPTLNIQGLGRVTFGDARPVREASIRSQELGFYAWREFYAMALAAGVISFFAWLARRSDRVLLWYCIACMSWVLAGATWNAIRWVDFLPTLNRALLLYRQYGLAVPAAILSLRIAGIRRPRFETGLWIFLAVELLSGLWPLSWIMVKTAIFDVVNAVLLVAGAVIILRAAQRPYRWPDITAAASIVGIAGLMLFEPARIFGWVDVESPIWRPYHVPVLIFAIGAAIFDRHVRAIWRMERSNAELQQRVDEKAREIDAYHAEREERLRQQALIRDRQRILADMHDGLGASLVGLLRYAQAGKVESQGLELRVKEALQELRIALDALEPAEGDLGSVLGKLRYRLEPLIESAGVSLSWDVDELPPVEALEPSAVFAIQRILLEAVSNAVQHAGARRIRIAAHTGAHSAIRITVEDDGKGFNPALASAGLGLASMRRRSEGLGATLGIATAPGGGTVVSLAVPRSLAVQAPTVYPVAEAALRA